MILLSEFEWSDSIVSFLLSEFEWSDSIVSVS